MQAKLWQFNRVNKDQLVTTTMQLFQIICIKRHKALILQINHWWTDYCKGLRSHSRMVVHECFNGDKASQWKIRNCKNSTPCHAKTT